MLFHPTLNDNFLLPSPFFHVGKTSLVPRQGCCPLRVVPSPTSTPCTSPTCHEHCLPPGIGVHVGTLSWVVYKTGPFCLAMGHWWKPPGSFIFPSPFLPFPSPPVMVWYHIAPKCALPPRQRGSPAPTECLDWLHSLPGLLPGVTSGPSKKVGVCLKLWKDSREKGCSSAWVVWRVKPIVDFGISQE